MEEILLRLKQVEERLDNLEKNKNVKKTPKTKGKPLDLESYIKNMEKGEYSCSYYPKTGNSKLLFCNEKNNLLYEGKEMPEVMNDITWKNYRFFRCKAHSKLAKDANIDLGYQELTKHYGEIKDDTVIAKSEEEPEVQLSQILTGNTVDVITTPSKAIPKKKQNDDYIDQGEYLDEPVNHNEETVIIRYHKTKTGTPKRKPSPVILGVCVDSFDKNNYLDNLKAPNDKIKTSIGLKYAPIEDKADVVVDENKSIPQVKTEDEDISMGLTKTKPKEEEDPYKADTDDEDITALLDDLKK